ncbi:MAG: hypothetical protein WC509_03330 [Candidatus Izemoplasmatales bacterium]
MISKRISLALLIIGSVLLSFLLVAIIGGLVIKVDPNNDFFEVLIEIGNTPPVEWIFNTGFGFLIIAAFLDSIDRIADGITKKANIDK